MHVLILHFRWTASLEEENPAAMVKGRKRMMVERRWRKEKMAEDDEEEVKKPANKKWRPMG